MKRESNLDKVNWVIHRVVTQAKPEKLGKAKWVLYSAVGISSLLLLGCDGGTEIPKYPRAAGD
jgi:hypothetical protein